jgi:hypothetical protein
MNALPITSTHTMKDFLQHQLPGASTVVGVRNFHGFFVVVTSKYTLATDKLQSSAVDDGGSITMV